MQEYLGAEKKTKEHHVDELTEEEKNLFRQKKLVFLKSSVPTYTITAFWQSGNFNGMEWEPLFKRTEK